MSSGARTSSRSRSPLRPQASSLIAAVAFSPLRRSNAMRELLLCVDGSVQISRGLFEADEKSQFVLYTETCLCCRRARLPDGPRSCCDSSFCVDCALLSDRWRQVEQLVARLNQTPRGHVGGRYRYMGVASIKEVSPQVKVLDLQCQRTYQEIAFSNEPYLS